MRLLNELITLPATYSLTAEATTYVAGLLLEAEGIELPPKDQRQKQHAVIMGRELRKHLSEVEMTRRLLVGPLNDTTDKINEVAKGYMQPMRDMVTKLEDGVSEFDAAQERLLEEENRKRQAEIDRVAQERLKAEQAAEDLKASGNDALDDIAKANAEAALEAAEAKERAMIVAPPPETPKTAGTARGQKMTIAVLDLAALYAARPDLCRVEANLAAIREKCFPGMNIPGLKLEWTTKTTIRK